MPGPGRDHGAGGVLGHPDHRAPARPPPCRCRSTARPIASPSARSSATPATTRAAAALSTTMSRWAPCSPPRTRRTTSALCAGSPPTSWSCVAGRRPSSTGSTVKVSRAAVVVERQDGRGTGRRQLVEPAAVDDPRIGRPVGPQRRQHPLGEAGVGDADHLAADPPGVGHRAEQVEHGRDPDLPAGRGGEAERRVEAGAKQKPMPASSTHRRTPSGVSSRPRRAPRTRRPCRTATMRRGRRACTPGRRRRPRQGRPSSTR